MTRSKTRITGLLLILLALGGCTSAKIHNASEAFSRDLNIDEQQVQRAIITAINDRQWQVQSVKPNLIQAELTVRNRHHAEVDIPYSNTGFSINYRSSWGLNQSGEKIHRSYNKWVNNLRNNILKELDLSAGHAYADNLGIVKQGAETPEYFSIQEAITRATDAGQLDGSVRFFMEGEQLPASLHLRDSVTAHRKTNSSNKTSEEACLWAAQTALIALQNKAKSLGANAVTGIVSYYARDVYKSKDKFQCHSGLVVASVALRGTITNIE